MAQPLLLSKDKAKRAIGFLKEEYKGAKYYLNFKTPMDLLVAAILSAQTRDIIVNEITPELFKKYKTAKDYASASESELLHYVKRVTFPENKVKHIIKTCRMVEEKFHGKVPDEMEELVSLPGVGRKTANTILINAYGIIEGIPVDTWVIKLSYRIGFSENKNPDKIEQDLMRIVDKSHWKDIAYILKAHGHKICHSTLPLCSRCILKEICPKNGVDENR
jgi:endonuclease-3